ncbi:MAG: DUF2095 family protein [Candidatus Heimdallarchaeota archaeon]|nr:DUF2095 family protein [Candidatus Heimdallarchaeota archaeon]
MSKKINIDGMNLDPQGMDEEVPEGLTLEELESHFSSIANELKGGDISVENLLEKEKKKQPPFFRNYDPNVLDFLARANTHEECVEIIEYCLTKQEISKEEAENLMEKLNTHGPDFFGTRKPGYYDSKLV